MNIHPKVAGAPIAGMIAVIIVWLLSLAKITVPPDVIAAFTGLIGLAVSYVIPSPPAPPAGP